jgi:ADP-heptose:LPS heptosyltransferase
MAHERSDDCRIIVAGDPGHHPFYEYADEYWWTPDFFRRHGFTRDCLDVRPYPDRDRYVAALRHLMARELVVEGEVGEIVEPRRFLPGDQEHARLTASDEARGWRDRIIQSGAIGPDYVCVFPRKRSLNPQKNWPAENWERLCTMLRKEHGLSTVVLGGEGTQSGSIAAWTC